LRNPRLLPVLGIGVTLAVLQQWCGINVIFNYAEEVFSAAGYALSSILLNIVITGVVMCVFTFVAIATVERLGRRRLMLLGCASLDTLRNFGGTLLHQSAWSAAACARSDGASLLCDDSRADHMGDPFGEISERSLWRLYGRLHDRAVGRVLHADVHLSSAEFVAWNGAYVLDLCSNLRGGVRVRAALPAVDQAKDAGRDPASMARVNQSGDACLQHFLRKPSLRFAKALARNLGEYERLLPTIGFFRAAKFPRIVDIRCQQFNGEAEARAP